MGDGQVFSDPSLIQPGWRLRLPAAAAGGQPASQDPSDPQLQHHPGHPSGDRHFREPHAGAGNQGGRSAGSVGAAGPQAAGSGTRPSELTGQHEEVQQAVLFTLGMLAGAALVTLERLRHRQRQHRRPGRRIALPADTAGQRIEQKLRAAAPPAPPASLRDALCDLSAGVAESGDPLPPIVGIHLTASSIDVLLSAPAAGPPPPPFTTAPGRQGMCWTADLRDASPEWTTAPLVPGEVGDLLPGLFTAGATEGGGYLLLDLEAMRVTCCGGPADLSDRLLVTAATELASSRWSGWYDLVLAGCDELEVLGRAERCRELDEALDVLEARTRTIARRLADDGQADVRTRRMEDPEDEDWGLTLLVSRLQPTPEQMSRLLDLADGPGGVAALVAGDIQAADGKLAPTALRLEPDPAGPGQMKAVITLAYLGPQHPLVVWPQTLTVSEYEALAGLFTTAVATSDVSPDADPYGDYGGPPWMRFAAAPVLADVDEGLLSRPVSLPEPAGPPEADEFRELEEPAELSEFPGPPGRHQRHHPRPAGLGVGVLGPFELAGSAEPLQPKQAELVLALALHSPVGLSNSALCTLLGADADHPRPADSVRQLITRTRRRLGQAADGQEYIIHLGSGIYVLHADVRLDWAEFSALARRGRADRNAGDLHAALELVRGQPFAECYHWWIDIALVETMRAEIVDTADLLAQLELSGGNPHAARRAARIGLSAETAAEQLWRALMRAEFEAGNPAGVTDAWTACLDAITEIAPGGEPHPDTELLFRQLSRGGQALSLRH
jgi:DNA-binding SARP family transcriptional activator